MNAYSCHPILPSPPKKAFLEAKPPTRTLVLETSPMCKYSCYCILPNHIIPKELYKINRIELIPRELILRNKINKFNRIKFIKVNKFYLIKFIISGTLYILIACVNDMVKEKHYYSKTYGFAYNMLFSYYSYEFHGGGCVNAEETP